MSNQPQELPADFDVAPTLRALYAQVVALEKRVGMLEATKAEKAPPKSAAKQEQATP